MPVAKNVVVAVLCLIALAIAMPAQTVMVTVQGTMADPLYVPGTNPGSAPAGANCTVLVTGASRMGTTGGGVDFAPTVGPVAIVNGAYSFQLAANASLAPAGTSYNAAYTCRRPGTSETIAVRETWLVPASAGPLTIGAIRVNAAPSPAVLFDPAQIKKNGALEGQCLKIINGVVAWGSCGPSNLSYTALTNGQYAAMTNGQYTAMTN